jgi:hypothetical protein
MIGGKVNRIAVGDTVAFRRRVTAACGASAGASLRAFRAVVTDIAGEWLFLRERCGRERAMPAANMCKVGRNGVALELV